MRITASASNPPRTAPIAVWTNTWRNDGFVHIRSADMRPTSQRSVVLTRLICPVFFTCQEHNDRLSRLPNCITSELCTENSSFHLNSEGRSPPMSDIQPSITEYSPVGSGLWT